MTAKRSLGLETLRFLRPTFCGLTVLAIAVLTCELLSNYRGDFKPTPLESDLQSITQPSPELSPEDVVWIQLDALSESDTALSVLQCLCFASPENRTVTGPLDRFGKMIRSAPFDVFRKAKGISVGKTQIVAGQARIFVTVVSQKAEPHAFVWVLGKQQLPPFAECWMTDGVMHVNIPGDVTDKNATSSETI